MLTQDNLQSDASFHAGNEKQGDRSASEATFDRTSDSQATILDETAKMIEEPASAVEKRELEMEGEITKEFEGISISNQVVR